MGHLSKSLEEFRELSKEYYEKIKIILEEEYCWKCPQRSTQTRIACREVDPWIRLAMALEDGIKDSWGCMEYSKDHVNVINAKFMEKNSIKSNQHSVILKLNDDKKPYCKKGQYVVVTENFSNIKKGDLVVIPQICPVAKYFYLKMDFMGFPFKIDKVKRVFHENNIKYIEITDGSRVTFYEVSGLIMNVFSKKDPIFKELKLK